MIVIDEAAVRDQAGQGLPHISVSVGRLRKRILSEPRELVALSRVVDVEPDSQALVFQHVAVPMASAIVPPESEPLYPINVQN